MSGMCVWHESDGLVRAGGSWLPARCERKESSRNIMGTPWGLRDSGRACKQTPCVYRKQQERHAGRPSRGPPISSQSAFRHVRGCLPSDCVAGASRAQQPGRADPTHSVPLKKFALCEWWHWALSLEGPRTLVSVPGPGFWAHAHPSVTPCPTPLTSITPRGTESGVTTSLLNQKILPCFITNHLRVGPEISNILQTRRNAAAQLACDAMS